MRDDYVSVERLSCSSPSGGKIFAQWQVGNWELSWDFFLFWYWKSNSRWFSKRSVCTSDWTRHPALVLDLSESTYRSDVNALAPSLALLPSAGFPGAISRARSPGGHQPGPAPPGAEAAAPSVTLTLFTDLLHSAAVTGNSWWFHYT